MKATVYVFWNAAGKALYVGATTTGQTRLRSHRRTKDWWDEVATAWFEHFGSAEEAYEREAGLIDELAPAYNVGPAILISEAKAPVATPSARLIFRRRTRGYTQASLAEKVGVTTRAVQRWEGGHFTPSPRRLVVLAEVLDCAPEWFYEAEQEPAA